ncbi:hypothetical protein DIZ27_14615 [Streptomyces sp. NWU339]|uniref:hypothetical protein n=1 Tax=Streptomyces sp. NWU339 TaxID=2185284 RepID=UPI000D680ACB|nr:hypothetical protein [Streptomyces sp. NWU339]PWI09765.1 hypothetical protein DIZ27_14615 [Streptomyces sp. NWU339]
MPSLDWFDEDDDTVDFVEAAQEHLLKTVGDSTRRRHRRPGRTAALKCVGVEVEENYRTEPPGFLG